MSPEVIEQKFQKMSEFLLNKVLPQMKQCARHGIWGGIKEHYIFVYRDSHITSLNTASGKTFSNKIN